MTIQQYASFDVEAAGLNATSKTNPALAKMVAAWENKNAKRAMQGTGFTLMAVSLAACGGGSSSDVVSVTTPVTVDVNFDVANVSSGNSVGLTFNVSDMAPDVQNVQLKATGSAEAGDKVTFVFEAEEDVVVLDGSSTISGFSTIEVQNGTVDFTALGGAALTDTTLLLGSGAIVTATQLLTLTDVEIREGAVDGDLTVNFAVGDDAAAVISKLGEFSDLAVKVRVEGGALTEAQAGQMSAVASDVTGETDDEAVVSTYTLQELLAILDDDGNELPDAYVLSDGVLVAEDAVTVADVTESLPALLAIVAGAQNGDEITLSVTYTLSDTLANLTAADAAVVSGAASYAF